ncbi:MAG TPA: sigma 54-interacting transcriptional regulator, partial [Spirochaetota bacterium]|nr:sigma 54-interacting transcriptional regulator [Spirochaetota bacterium]
DKQGKFEAAHQGSLFLDEIADISANMQVKLLRVLQDKKITRVGDNKEIKCDFRLICASNKNLRQLVKENKFREDLFYRLNVFPIYTVPLRERRNDIMLLSAYFIEKFNNITGKHITGLSPQANSLLLEYCWPGNVRELENVIEHAFVVCPGGTIGPFDLPKEILVASVRDGICRDLKESGKPLSPYHFNNFTGKTQKRRKLSRKTLKNILEKNNNSRQATAQELGISTVALWKKMKKNKLL